MHTEQEIKETIALRLRELRLEKGWSQDKLAKEAGLTTVGYGDIERGNGTPLVSSLARIAAALGCTLNDILPMNGLAPKKPASGRKSGRKRR